MAATAVARLYTPELLALAVRLSDYPMNTQYDVTGDARSRSCGSSLVMGLNVGKGGQIAEIGMQVTACAVGQAAAAIFAESGVERDRQDLTAALSAIEQWLTGHRAHPDWPGLAVLDAARDHPGRHGALLLPWRAALAALCKLPAAG